MSEEPHIPTGVRWCSLVDFGAEDHSFRFGGALVARFSSVAPAAAVLGLCWCMWSQMSSSGGRSRTFIRPVWSEEQQKSLFWMRPAETGLSCRQGLLTRTSSSVSRLSAVWLQKNAIFYGHRCNTQVITDNDANCSSLVELRTDIFYHKM